MPTQTPNYSFEKPTEGADNDVWGGFLNQNWDSIDSLLKALTDRVDAIEAAYQIPVGGLYTTANNVDPATEVGYGTWVRVCEGRGVWGIGDAGLGDGYQFTTPGQQYGQHTITLSEAQLPWHTHTFSGTTDTQGAHAHNVTRSVVGAGSGIDNGPTFGNQDQNTVTDTQGAHAHNFSGTTGGAGSGGSVETIPPVEAYYIWKRVS